MLYFTELFADFVLLVGHAGTLDYILSELDSDYYDIWKQTFPAVSGDVFESRLVIGDKLPNSTTTMGLTPPTKNGEPVFGNLVLAHHDGCRLTDYPHETLDSIAFVRRGTCSFGQKSELAGMAGAKAIVVYNTDAEALHGTLGTPSPYHVASFGLSGREGEPIAKRLAEGESIDAIAYMDAVVKTIETQNILAQTKQGDPENCVMIGGHSDSVTEGPGINDDGSGSISVLEVAHQLTHFDVNNCVRFAWWAAEEEGLLGSNYYVASLTDEENLKIRVFLDYDMMASPNFVYQIYDANNKENPDGSGDIKDFYVDWYEQQGLNYTFIPFDGRSDYDGFIRNGIPGGGIATGAEGVKTQEEESQFGGKEGEWYDPCYHQLCDDLTNLNMTAWEVNTKLIAHSVATYAKSFKGFPERSEDQLKVKASSQDMGWVYKGGKMFM